jgi:fucose 4-O-acetylase-like acetyltransferase
MSTGRFFRRTQLDIGRLSAVVAVVVTGYAALSAFWLPVRRSVGWLLVPLGQATLYVFVTHVFFVLVVANVPVLNRGNVPLDTAAHAVVLGLLWLMVRKRFLFGVIPR